jgi:cardiolipin synthase
VRVLVDGVGSLLGGLRALRLLRRAGAELRSFRPPLRLGSRPLSNLRNHRKFVIADAAIMWAGGRNLGENYFRQAAADSSWIDLSFELRGEPVLHALAQFEQDWATTRRGQRDVSVHGGRDAVPTAAALARAAGGREERARAQFVPSGPDQSHDTLYSVLLAATFRAQRRIRIVSPYFILDEALTNGLRLAALRGVGVTVVLPLRSNHRVADWARSRALRELSAAAVRVICVEAMLHAKVVLVDDDLAVCGSANFDVRSLLLNYESNLLLYGAREIGWLARWVDDVAASGRPYEARPPGLLRDIGEGLLIAIAFEL